MFCASYVQRWLHNFNTSQFLAVSRFSKLIITKVCVFPSVLSFCEMLLCRVQGEKRPFRHRLHSAAGPQAPAELTVAIATTMDNYPAKDRYSRQSERHLVFMLKICCPLHCQVTFTFFFLPFVWISERRHLSGTCYLPSWWLTALNHKYYMCCCSNMFEGLPALQRESPPWRDLLQALNCQQTFTLQVATCKYGLLIIKKEKWL